ncbi:MAG: NYN domain-containing protein [Saprospiraceae bacterium]|nr:NYN domain-containing protein [Saprospiraceae bacterium]
MYKIQRRPTTLKVLKFATDLERLFAYLKERWNCEKVFFYPGIEPGDVECSGLFDKITNIGGIVRSKYYYVYNNSDKIVSANCPKYDTEITQRINNGHTWKCNCDVEMTMEILDQAKENTELMIFTGDGDFVMLIESAVSNGSKVTIFSSAKKVQKGARYSTSRLSTKLRKLTQASGLPVKFMEIDNLKFQIKKKA